MFNIGDRVKVQLKGELYYGVIKEFYWYSAWVQFDSHNHASLVPVDKLEIGN